MSISRGWFDVVGLPSRYRQRACTSICTSIGSLCRPHNFPARCSVSQFGPSSPSYHHDLDLDSECVICSGPSSHQRKPSVTSQPPPRVITESWVGRSGGPGEPPPFGPRINRRRCGAGYLARAPLPMPSFMVPTPRRPQTDAADLSCRMFSFTVRFCSSLPISDRPLWHFTAAVRCHEQNMLKATHRRHNNACSAS